MVRSIIPLSLRQDILYGSLRRTSRVAQQGEHLLCWRAWLLVVGAAGRGDPQLDWPTCTRRSPSSVITREFPLRCRCLANRRYTNAPSHFRSTSTRVKTPIRARSFLTHHTMSTHSSITASDSELSDAWLSLEGPSTQGLSTHACKVNLFDMIHDSTSLT